MKRHQTAFSLLEYLKDGKFYSGEALGGALGITRSAVWKAIKQLQGMGVDLQSVCGRGYRISGALDLLNKDKILERLSERTVLELDDLCMLKNPESTNTTLLGLPKTKKRIACFAESQNQGKGRNGRIWKSPFGTNIYHSLLWHFSKPPQEMVGLSLAIGIALIQTVITYTKTNGFHLKWPNDLLYLNKKVGGVLVEMANSSSQHSSVVIGVGINTSMSAVQTHGINQRCTTLKRITEQPINRNQLCAVLLNTLIKTLQIFEEQGLSPFLVEWKKYDAYIGQPVIVSLGKVKIHGKMKGLSRRGELIIIDEANCQRKFFSGEVSLRLGNA